MRIYLGPSQKPAPSPGHHLCLCPACSTAEPRTPSSSPAPSRAARRTLGSSSFTGWPASHEGCRSGPASGERPPGQVLGALNLLSSRGAPPSQSPHVATDREALGIPSGGGFHVCIALRYECAGLNERLLEMKLVSFQGAQKTSRTTVLYVLM